MVWLEKRFEKRFNPRVVEPPCFETLRPDPRFQNLTARIGLPQTAVFLARDADRIRWNKSKPTYPARARSSRRRPTRRVQGWE